MMLHVINFLFMLQDRTSGTLSTLRINGEYGPASLFCLRQETKGTGAHVNPSIGIPKVWVKAVLTHPT